MARSALPRRISIYAAQVPLYTGYLGQPPTATGTGLTGEYYDDLSWNNLKMTRTDATVNFNWGSGSPDPGIEAETFRVRWTGYIQPLYSQSYTFYASADGGTELWIHNQKIIDSWTDLNTERISTSITLTAGHKYPITMTYYENTGTARAILSWASSSQTKAVVP